MAFKIGFTTCPKGIKVKLIHSNGKFEYINFVDSEEFLKFLESDKHYTLSNNVYQGAIGRKISSLEEIVSGDFVIIKEDSEC